jgi:prolyl oligopeptidase
MAPPSAPFVATGSTLFATSIILSLVSSFVSRTKGNRLLSSSLASATSGQTLITPANIPSGEKTVSYWEKFDGEHSFLEDVGGDSALSWVKARNVHAIHTLGKPESSPLYSQVLTILNSKDKIPNVSKIGDFYYNFWQDESNQRGLLRRTSPESYRSATPNWETVLDLDLLGKSEGESWVYKGYTLYSPDDKKDPMAYRRILLELSKGGADAVVIREFDLSTKKFITSEENGFQLPEAKSGVTWKNENVLIVGTDMKNTDGSDTVTASGYPRVVYEWTRGTSLATAKKVYEGEKSDVSVGGYVVSSREDIDLAIRSTIAFIRSELSFAAQCSAVQCSFRCTRLNYCTRSVFHHLKLSLTTVIENQPLKSNCLTLKSAFNPISQSTEAMWWRSCIAH